MTKYKALAITTDYWKPHSDYASKILFAVEGKVIDNDFVVVSEKAVSTALGCMVDESEVKPGLTAKVLVSFWMRASLGLPPWNSLQFWSTSPEKITKLSHRVW